MVNSGPKHFMTVNDVYNLCSSHNSIKSTWVEAKQYFS